MILKSKNFNNLLLLILSLSIVVISNIKLFQLESSLIITKPPLSKYEVEISSLGDKQLLFRKLMLELQYMGDSFGRSTNLNQYDYKLLYQWFKLMDTLNHSSNFTPAIAAYYFGFNYETDQLAWIIRYLQEHAWNDLDHKWWWLYQASYLAYHRQKNYPLAIKLASHLATTKATTPIWVKQLPALYYAGIGEHQHALEIIENILIKHQNTISPGEKNFMNYFIDDCLKKLTNN